MGLRLYGVPEAISDAVAQFPDLRSAVNTVIVAMQMGIPVARIELLDDVQMDACIRYSKLDGYEAKPTLFFEFHGTQVLVVGQANGQCSHVISSSGRIREQRFGAGKKRNSVVFRW